MNPIAEMHRLFRNYPEAIRNTMVIAEACTFALDELKYVYPEEINKSGRSPLEELEYLCFKGAHAFYGEVIPEKVLNMIAHEMDFVRKMDYANYFLFVEDIVREARSRGILCQGRGSAANSAICFCLGVTSVDPMKFDLLFERFILRTGMNRRILMWILSTNGGRKLCSTSIPSMAVTVQGLWRR